MNTSFSALALLCAAGAVHACNADATDDDQSSDNGMDADGTDTGNPYDDPDGEGTAGDNCTEEETEVDPGGPAPLGFNPQLIVDLVAGEHTSSLQWLDSQTEYGPESGLSEITLNITPIGAPLFVDREVRMSSNDGREEDSIGLGEIYVVCNDSIRLNVSIHMTTAGGAFDEIVETTIEANTADFASGSFSIDLTEVSGAFEAMPVPPPNFVLTKSSLTAQLGFTSYGSVGAFDISSEFRSTDGAAIGGSTGGAVGEGSYGGIAHFPAENFCGRAAVSVTKDQVVRGLSMGQALDALNAMSPEQVRFQSGAPSDLTLAFTSTEARVCARFDEAVYGDTTAGNMTLEFPGSVRLISTDGRIDGTVPLKVTTSVEGGRQEIRAEGTIDSQTAAGAAGLPAQFGIQDPVDFSAYDGGFVQLLTLVAPDRTGGSLRAYGLDVPVCDTTPMIEPGGGMSVPGCRGTDRIPLWGAFWGSWDQNTQ